MSGSSTSKKIAIVVIVLVIIGVLWFVMKKPVASDAVNTAATKEPVASTTEQGANALSAIPVDPAVAAVKGSGVSDGALSKDAAAVDEQLKALSSDTATAKQ